MLYVFISFRNNLQFEIISMKENKWSEWMIIKQTIGITINEATHIPTRE